MNARYVSPPEPKSFRGWIDDNMGPAEWAALVMVGCFAVGLGLLHVSLAFLVVGGAIGYVLRLHLAAAAVDPMAMIDREDDDESWEDDVETDPEAE